VGDQGSPLLSLVFHLSHLLLRLLFYPNSQDSVTVFNRLHSHQTIQYITKCSGMLTFAELLPYVKALQRDERQKAEALLLVFKLKLDLSINDEDF